MINAGLTIVTGSDELAAEKCLEVAQNVLRRLSVPMKGFALYGKSVDLEHAPKVLRAAERTAFLIEGNGWRFHLAPIRHYAIDTFAVETALEFLSADMWIEEFAAIFPIRQAWLVNAEYDFWQNAEDPLQYTSRGIACENLPTKSNGLPPPLDQTVIDTSRNPGRRILRIGYVEAVGTPMWIGPEFWGLTGADKNKVVSDPCMNAEASAHGLVCLRPSLHLVVSRPQCKKIFVLSCIHAIEMPIAIDRQRCGDICGNADHRQIRRPSR